MDGTSWQPEQQTEMHFNAAKHKVINLRTENAGKFLYSERIVRDSVGMQVDMSSQQDTAAKDLVQSLSWKQRSEKGE